MGKVAVLGLGVSLSEFVKEDFELSIGVNDIWRLVETEAVVCLNSPTTFVADRLRYINGCKPKAFYSQMVMWDTRPDFVKIDFLPGYPDNFCNLDLAALPKSYCSPFVAAVIAWKYYDATEIHLFGVDMTNHPHLDMNICRRIKTHFKNLKLALEKKGSKLIAHGNGILTDIL